MTVMKEYMWEWNGPDEEMARPRRPGGGGAAVEPKHCDAEDPPVQRSPQLWRDHRQSIAGGGGIHVLVCCCNENDEELKVMLSTFRSERRPPCRVRVTFIVDSHSSGYYAERNETYMALRQLLPISDLTGSSEEKHEEARGSYGEFGCINHSGVLTKTQVPFDLYVKGSSLPHGKRNSLVLFFDEILPAKIRKGEAAEPEAVYILDADTGHPDKGLNDVCRMWRLLMAEEETAAYTCSVRPVNPLESFLAASQALEYAHVWDCVGESYYAAQTTARGTSIMLKYSCLLEDGRGALPPCGEGAQVPVLEALAKTAASLPAMILLDTSPNDGILVLLRQRGFDVRSCAVADAVTCVPNSLLEFYAQRRRWYAGTMTAVLSSLTGRENYFQADRGRIIMAVYTLVFYVYTHSSIVFLPALLTKGMSLIALHTFGKHEGIRGRELELRLFLAIWVFLAFNTILYTCKSYKQLWMWINVSSVAWMLLCALTLIGVSVLVTPWVGVGVLLAPFLLGALNVAGGDAAKWACMAMSAIPFVLVTSVHSVLVLLFAVATIDSTEWGTRDVSPFDSGVTGRRASEMFRTKLAFIFWIVVVPCGLGAVFLMSASYTVLSVAASVSVLALVLKLMTSILPSKLERARQRVLVGDAPLERPSSFRRGRTELAPIHGLPVDQLSGGQGRNNARKTSAVYGCPTENGGSVTADDGTPSPGSDPAFSFAVNGNGVDATPPAAVATPPRRETDEVVGTKPVVVRNSRSQASGTRSSRRGNSRSRSRSPSTSSRSSRLTAGTSRMSTSGMTVSESGADSEGQSIGSEHTAGWGDSPVTSAAGVEAPPRLPLGASFSGLFSRAEASDQMSVEIPPTRTRQAAGSEGLVVEDVEMVGVVEGRDWAPSSRAPIDGACEEVAKANNTMGSADAISRLDGENKQSPLDHQESPSSRSRLPLTAKAPSILESRGYGVDDRESPPIVTVNRSVDGSADGDAVPRRPPSIPHGGVSSRLRTPSTPELPPSVPKMSETSLKSSPSPPTKRGWGRRQSSGDDSENERIVAANTAKNAISLLGSRRKGSNFIGIRRAWALGLGSDDEQDVDSPVDPSRSKNGSSHNLYGVRSEWGAGQISFDSDGDNDAGSPVSRTISQVQRSSGRGLVGHRATWGLGGMGGTRDATGPPSVHEDLRRTNSRFGASLRSGWGRRQISKEESEDERIAAAIKNSARNAGIGRPGGRLSTAGIRSAWYRGDSYDSEDGRGLPNRAFAPNTSRMGRRTSGRGGLYARWGRSTMDSEDENCVPSPQPCARATRSGSRTPLSGIRGEWGRSSWGIASDRFLSNSSLVHIITPRSSAAACAPAPPSRPAPQPPVPGPRLPAAPYPTATDKSTPPLSAGRTADKVLVDHQMRSPAAGSVRSAVTTDLTTSAAGRPVAATPPVVTASEAEAVQQPSAPASTTTANDRTWAAGQSSVFDSSGSSSGDEDGGKPRGLRGVQILTDAALLEGTTSARVAGSHSQSVGRVDVPLPAVATPAYGTPSQTTRGETKRNTSAAAGMSMSAMGNSVALANNGGGEARSSDVSLAVIATPASRTPSRTTTRGETKRNTSAAAGLPIGAIGNSVALAVNGGEGRSSNVSLAAVATPASRTPSRTTRGETKRNTSAAAGLPIGARGNSVALAGNGGGEARSSSWRSTNFPVPRLETLRGMPGAFSDAEY